MKWFMTKLIYQIICGEGDHVPQFDEQLRLIQAESELAAFKKARRIGAQEEDCFLNNVNKPVHWKFIDVSEVHLLDVLTDGAEVYSRICEEENATHYISDVKLRAAMLLESSTFKATSLN